VPDFHELAVGYADDDVSCDGDVLAGRRVRRRRPEITGVGATSCQAHHHLVSFRDHVLNRDMKVREGFEDPSDPSFVFFTGANLGKARIMEEEVGGIELVKGGKMALVQTSSMRRRTSALLSSVDIELFLSLIMC
jgi:hypothetical protein